MKIVSQVKQHNKNDSILTEINRFKPFLLNLLHIYQRFPVYDLH